jgi:Tfp pilus tip-associated adhesin PilY1
MATAAAIRACLVLFMSIALLAQAHDWKIVPGERIGPLTPMTTFADLQQQFGAENVRREQVDIGEGFEEPGAIVYPGSASKRLAVLWRNGKEPEGPATVMICYGDNPAGTCEWKTEEGVTLGTTLSRLEALNRRPFRLSGFGWDYSGTVTSWNSGQLENVFNRKGRLIVRLIPRDSKPTPEYRQVEGDGDFSSGHPAMQKLDPRVYALTLQFEPER